jgi:hypothetical protein
MATKEFAQVLLSPHQVYVWQGMENGAEPFDQTY